MLDPGIPLGLLFSVQSDGTVSGTYTLTAIRAHTDVFKGIFTFGSTDGDTFSLDFFSLPVGIEGLCGGVVGTDMVEISGHCGDEVTIRYEDPFASGTFTGNVDCTLIF